MDNNSLQHHGILGQKWGVRRYQNKDGTLTPAGKRHVAQLDAEREKLESKQKKLDKKYYRVTGKTPDDNDQTTQKQKQKRKLSDLDDGELKAMYDRLKLENQYKDEYLKAHPKHTSFGKKYVDVLKDTVTRDLATYTISLGMGFLKKGVNTLSKKISKKVSEE